MEQQTITGTRNSPDREFRDFREFRVIRLWSNLSNTGQQNSSSTFFQWKGAIHIFMLAF